MVKSEKTALPLGLSKNLQQLFKQQCRKTQWGKTLCLYLLLAFHCSLLTSNAQTYNQIDESGNVTQRSENGRNANFNPHNNDTTSKAKEIPKGIYVWTVDRKFGDIHPAVVDTLPHLYPNSTLGAGRYGEFSNTGNNYTARLSRIFIDRPVSEQFIFTQPYSQVYKTPDQIHFTNTLSPITNASYDNCGDKQDGEDHLDVKFAVNAGKRLGMGFDLDYSYARGYFSNQSTSHFGSTFYASYLGDRYQMHTMFSLWHQKASENGGITNDSYVSHPESFDESYVENEIPTVLEQNWNRNDHQHLFLSHRYNVGFYRMEKMTEEEIQARKFAQESKQEKEKDNNRRDRNNTGGRPDNAKVSGRPDNARIAEPAGRPDNAKIAGDEPVTALSDSLSTAPADSLSADSVPGGFAARRNAFANDSTRIKVDTQEKLDSLLALERAKEQEAEDDSTMKKVFVPVTSFIHTLELNNHDRIYQAYATPTDYYAHYFYSGGQKYSGDSIYDQTRMLQMKNTLALALLEGFNKYAKAGLKAFATHEVRRFEMPDSAGGLSYQQKQTEHNVSIGGQLQKTEGHTLHYNLMAEAWLIGKDAGQLKLDFSTDLNFPFLGDTVQLAAKAFFYRLNPSFYYRQYHSRNFWWDHGDGLDKETRTRIEGLFTYRRTKTQLRVAIEEIQNYTYLGMSYDYSDAGRTNLTAQVMQQSSNINVLTAQLRQDFRLGPLNWENVVTYQNSSSKDALPLPALNLFTNLYLKFKIAHVLTVELGGAMSYFTKYEAPDFLPQMNQFAVQQNETSRVELGEFPFVDVYANMHLKRARFFVMMSNVANGSANKMSFLAPHYPTDGAVFRMGVSWNFFN